MKNTDLIDPSDLEVEILAQSIEKYNNKLTKKVYSRVFKGLLVSLSVVSSVLLATICPPLIFVITIPGFFGYVIYSNKKIKEQIENDKSDISDIKEFIPEKNHYVKDEIKNLVDTFDIDDKDIIMEDALLYNSKVNKRINENYLKDYIDDLKIRNKIKKMSLDDLYEQINYDLYSYYEVYDLPPFKVSNRELNNFVEITNDYLIEKDILEKDIYIYDIITFILKYTLSNILINHKKVITIKDLINNIDCLNSKYFNKTNISELKSILLEEFKDNYNVVSFEEYCKRKHI